MTHGRRSYCGGSTVTSVSNCSPRRRPAPQPKPVPEHRGGFPGGTPLGAGSGARPEGLGCPQQRPPHRRRQTRRAAMGGPGGRAASLPPVGCTGRRPCPGAAPVALPGRVATRRRGIERGAGTPPFSRCAVIPRTSCDSSEVGFWRTSVCGFVTFCIACGCVGFSPARPSY